jgi:beta-glucanase (GH16 family)
MQSTYSGHDSVMSKGKQYQTEENNTNYSVDIERNGGDLTETFNTFSMYWDTDSVRFAYNGKQYCEYLMTDQMSVSVHSLLVHPIFSNWMARAGYGATYEVGKHPEYAEFKMDYIRIYQTDAQPSQMLFGDGQYVKGEDVSADHTKVLYPEHGITTTY